MLRETSKRPAKVEVAVVDVALKYEAEAKLPTTRLRKMSTKPEKVEVAVVEVAVKYEELTLSAIRALP